MTERERVMIFRPSHGEIIVRGPEDLARGGIEIHPDVIERTWGPGAVERYKQAVVEYTAQSTTPGEHQQKNLQQGEYK